MPICEICGQPIEDSNLYKTTRFNIETMEWKQKYYHRDCICFCDICGEPFPIADIDNMFYDSDREYRMCDSCHDNCYESCADCGITMWHEDLCWIGDTRYCPSCADNHISCEGCGCVIDKDNDYYTKYDGYYYCVDCRPISNYLYDPEWKYLTTQDFNMENDFLYGIELEIDKGDGEVINKLVRALYSTSKDLYYKRDGSLNTGFEIISHPASLDYHLNDINWKQICELCSRWGFTSHNARTCGLHIHVGRHPMSVLSNSIWRKIQANIALLVDNLWDDICIFARRGESMYNVKPQIDTTVADLENTALYRTQNHHYAVSTRSYQDGEPKGKTVELRMFRGSLNPETVIATIVFADCLTRFAKDHTMADCLAATFDDVAAYTTNPIFKSYLKRRNLIKEDK